MDINTKTQQTNIFAKGMNTDVSDALIGHDQYRMAQNMRYVTNDQENSGEMHMIEGAKKVIADLSGVRGMISIREYGAIVTEDENKTWRVYRFDKPDTLTKIAEISDHPLSRTNKLSLVTKYEDYSNVKLYIADGESPVCVINLKSDDAPITNYQQIVSYPSAILLPPTEIKVIDGTLKEGVVQYSYRLYNTHGSATNVSLPTRLIPLHNKDVALTNTKNLKGFEQGTTSNKGVLLKMNIVKPYTNLIVYRITYVEAGQPPLIEKIVDTEIDKDIKTYTLSDTGIDALEILTVEEYEGLGGIHIMPKVIESKDNYMFAANVKTAQSEFDKKLEGCDFTCVQTDEGIYDMRTPLASVVGHYSGPYISWKFVTKTVVADRNGNKKELIDIAMGDDTNKGYGDVYTCYNLKSLRRDELYRYGIVWYNDHGEHSSVFWIADVRTPSMFIPGYETFGIENDQLVVKPLGIEFTINQIPEGAGIVGYEIVRCNRTIKDVATIAQGVISKPGRRFSTVEEYVEKFPLTPTGWITTADIGINTNGIYLHPGDRDLERWNYSNYALPEIEKTDGINNNIVQFVCPEYCYQEDSTKDLISKDGLYLKLTMFIYPDSFYTDNELESLEIINMGGDTTHATRYGDRVLSPLDDQGDNNEYCGSRMNIGNTYSNMFYGLGQYSYVLFCPAYTHAGLYFARHTDKSIREASIGQGFNPTTETGEVLETVNYSWEDIDHNSRHQYIKLYKQSISGKCGFYEQSGFYIPELNNIDVSSTSFAKALSWDDLALSENKSLNGETYPLKYVDQLVNIGDDTYVNWVAGNLYNAPVMQVSDGFYLANPTLNDYLNDILGTVMGPAGKTVLLKLDVKDGQKTGMENTPIVDGKPLSETARSAAGTYLCNLRQNVVPYGGDSDEAKRLSVYTSHGYYFTNDNTVNEVFDGDCYIQPFEYVSMFKFYHHKINHPRNSCIVYAIPVETNINLAYSYGYEFSKNFTTSGNATNMQDQPSDVYGFFSQNTPLYLYNGAYSSESKIRNYAAYLDDPTTIHNEDYRCYYSDPKDNNEAIDNWLTYQPANFLDVDTRKGPITGLRTFHNILIFWQPDATGIFSVNERTAITDESNMPLLLDTGGVLARYDYINTSNGMKENQFADTQSDSTLYWWDYNKGDICAYAGGQEMVVLSKVKSVANFLNSRVGAFAAGPALTFDKKYNEMIASVTKGGSLVYSEQTQSFVGVYTMNHIYSLMFADKLYLHEYEGLYLWDECEDNAAKDLNSLPMKPYLKYIVNDNQQLTKVFDNVIFGGRFYGGDDLKDITFKFATPLKLNSQTKDGDITNIEYDFRFAVPRHNNSPYGDRMRGKTMQCEFISESNSLDLSIQYITTKYRISWS